MSSSDYISLKKYRSINSAFVGRNSGNITQRAKINAIRNVLIYDTSVNNINPTQTWFDVAISNPSKCLYCSTVKDTIVSNPLMFKSNMSYDNARGIKYSKPEVFCNKPYCHN